jgi:hypothetical protein
MSVRRGLSTWRPRALAAALALGGSLVLLPAVAGAQDAPAVALTASAERITFGQDVRLSVTLTPAAGGEAVQITDEAGDVVAQGTTRPNGTFDATIRPDGTRTYLATVLDATSEGVTVAVRAVADVRMSPVRLFDRVVVRGAIEPARPGRNVEVTLLRGGRAVETRRVPMGRNGGYSVRFEVGAPGVYRARASFGAGDLVRDRAVTPADLTPLPRLSSGDSGAFVRLLEARLMALDYRVAGGRDGRYDFRTADAVVAFHKVQGMSRSFAVSAATWRRLADPLVPRPRRDWNAFHFEVDQTKQVLYTVEGGAVTNILHVSTGAGGATRDGSFRVWRKLAGFSPNHLYYPSYFDGLRALHGWTEVPTVAASHGCVRIPYWNARWVYGLAAYGTRVVIYH